MPSHASLHISLNVCHVTSHHPPKPPTTPHDPSTPHHKPTPSHASLHISPNVCHVTSHHPSHPTHAFTCIPTHIPQCLSCYFTPPTKPTHPTHAFPHIPTHIPQCLSCYFTPPTPPHQGPHTPPHTSNPHLPMHPYPTLHLNIFKVQGVVGLKIFYKPPPKFLKIME